jgi:hypothetical protein
MVSPAIAETLIGLRLLGIRHRAGVFAPERRGFFFQISKRPLSIKDRMEKARADMAALKARLDRSK